MDVVQVCSCGFNLPHVPLLTPHLLEPFTTGGLGMPPQALALGASLFCILGQNIVYMAHCLFAIATRTHFQLKEHCLVPVV